MHSNELLKMDPVDLYRLFIVRSDLVAFQRPDGRYAGNVKTNEKQWLEYLQDHLSGNMTLGSYVLDPENRSKWLCLDIDCKENPNSSKELALLLSFYLSEDLNIPHSVEYSGQKGYHIWIFLEKPIESRHLRKFAQWFLGKFAGLNKSSKSEYIEFINNKRVNIEIFPKQDKTNGIGSLVKIPLGKHRVSGNRSYFLSFTDKTVDPDYLNQLSRKSNSLNVSHKNIEPTVTGLPQTPGEWNVYRTLKELCNEEEMVKVPLKRLADKTGYCRQTAAKWMHKLAQKGLIDTKLLATDTFQVYRPKYQKTTRLIKREYFISVNALPEYIKNSSSKVAYRPSFKISAPYRKDRHPSLVFLPMIGIWKDYATGRVFLKNDPVLKNCTSLTYFHSGGY